MQSERRNALRKILVNDWALFLDPISIHYLSGFSGSNALLLVSPSSGEDLLITDARYRERIKLISQDINCKVEINLFEALPRLLPQKINLVVDPKRLTMHQGAVLKDLLPNVVIDARDNLLDEMRAVKDEAEIASLRKACDITSQSLWYLINDLRAGMSERQIAKKFWQNALERGADELAFETIVASGVNGASAHHLPTGRVLEHGDMVTIDCGVKYQGYCSDMTRTVFIGQSHSWQVEIYQAVMQAQGLARESAQVMMKANEIDAKARDYIHSAGFGEYFIHGTGHGVGLEVHEAPYISKTNAVHLKENFCFTVEPGIYLPGQGGVRIEDTCILTGEGLEVLTKGSHEIVCVG